MEPELEADIHYLSPEEGGRSHGIASGYRGQFYYYGRDWDAVQQLVDKEMCQPGETVRVYLNTLSPQSHLGMFHIGQEFEIHEGRKTVAKGVIRTIFRPDFECKADWKKLKEEVYFEDGSLRDIYVPNATADDWEKWTNWIRRSPYRFEWYDPHKEKFVDYIDFSTISDWWQVTPDKVCPTIRVFVDHIQINAHFFCDYEMENDISPTDIQCWGDHVRLLNYMKIMSYVLEKPVILTNENFHDNVLLSVHGEKIDSYR